jgi:hypothetical protein
LTPFGIIMKINRQPLPELTEEILQRDHEFWKQFSKRLTGDIRSRRYAVKAIADWVEKTYLRRDFSGFSGIGGLCGTIQPKKHFQNSGVRSRECISWRSNDLRSRHTQSQTDDQRGRFCFSPGSCFLSL